RVRSEPAGGVVTETTEVGRRESRGDAVAAECFDHAGTGEPVFVPRPRRQFARLDPLPLGVQELVRHFDDGQPADRLRRRLSAVPPVYPSAVVLLDRGGLVATEVIHFPPDPLRPPAPGMPPK